MTKKDFDFLLDCANIEEFEVQCALASIDIKEAVKRLSFFTENGKQCLALDHFYWFDENGQQIDAPQEVNEGFNCSYCSQLKSLEGAPREINNFFDCSNCVSLTSLEGAPQKVENFYCSDCTSLTSLESVPQKIDGYFDCSNCASLTSLEGAPQEVGESFSCSNCRSLTSLKGAPQEVNNSGFYCFNCISLTSLEGAPQKVGGHFDCSCCDLLTSLEGSPQKVGRNFDCADCASLTSLEGAPQKVGGHIIFTRCDSLQKKQIDAYVNWLKTGPRRPYHDLYAENRTNESMTSIDEFIRSVMNEDKYSVRRCLNDILENKCKKRLANVLFHQTHRSIHESLYDSENEIKKIYL